MQKKRFTLQHARKHLPVRLESDNKTRGGKCLVIGGAPGQWGAAILCATAAARTGAGYTYIYDFKNSFPTLAFPNFLLRSNATDLKKFDVVALGPGFKDKKFLKKAILLLKKENHLKVVLDAEALNTLAHEKRPFTLPKTWIMTPHEGEMARLLGCSSDLVRKKRELSLRKIQKMWGCIVLLKGSKNLIADGKSIYEIQTGNSSLAKAGTGDVLTGIIAGFLSQNVSPLQAVCLGVLVHGKISELWVQEGNDHLSLLATDLIDRLPMTIAHIRSKKSA